MPDDGDWPGHITPEERHEQVEAAKRVPGMIWLGDLTGFEITAHTDPYTYQHYIAIDHRCGWGQRLDPDGIYGVYAANLILRIIEEHAHHSCQDTHAS